MGYLSRLQFVHAQARLIVTGTDDAREGRTVTSRERVLGILDGAAVDSLPFLPITMLFAARLTGVPYRRYATGHRVLVDAQLRVAGEFGADILSCISDPAREAADCGAPVIYFDDQPPSVDASDALLADKAALARLKAPAPESGERMADRLAAVALFKERAGDDRLVEGWVEGPCAEAADLRGLQVLMMDFYEDPGFVRDLFAFARDLGIAFGRAQAAAGADWIGIGDAAASLIGPELYREFVFPYEKQLVDALHAAGTRVRLHICGNITPLLEDIGKLGCDVVDLDWMVPVDAARSAMGPDQVLLGNIDPVRVVLNGAPEEIHAGVRACHEAAGPRFIVGAGCEIPRDTPHANLRAMRDYARAATPQTPA